ncbi:hypothetical protein IC744_14005 [Microbacterium hominis]|uniref:hypothetical protein n=1 Tax=Microbacterium TaxID=33882 RepID=UPI00168BAED0|nr:MULTISPECIES: hypothetical protein [Microbacterium]QOC24394.1 hypothetical protein IC745_08245 [Microbacterium hominis]QOC28472.1 hypothetical protein IC744_14005 [Microbacterium hominis]QYF96325.1 hypothetical protein KY498_08900 [Microbacterium sp. PAMC21962]
MDDLTALTDAQLDAHLNAVINEQERRRRLANAPAQVAQIAAAFIADGGDRAALTAAIGEA